MDANQMWAMLAQGVMGAAALATACLGYSAAGRAERAANAARVSAGHTADAAFRLPHECGCRPRCECCQCADRRAE